MLRRMLTAKAPEDENGFRMRGKEVTRVECFSDCVFGFALTLLVIALEVPKTFAELMGAMRGFVAFAACFAIFVSIWNRHYIYCRRYGLEDGTMRVLTSILLFVVLLYVYPLKFLFKVFVDSLVFRDPTTARQAQMGGVEVAHLFMIYGLGFAAVSIVFFLLYLHAYRNRLNLELTPVEIFDTRWSLIENALMCCVPVLSILIAAFAPTKYVSFAGWAYLSMSLVGYYLGSARGSGRRKLMEAAAAAA